jgi:hypothetical protein
VKKAVIHDGILRELPMKDSFDTRQFISGLPRLRGVTEVRRPAKEAPQELTKLERLGRLQR